MVIYLSENLYDHVNQIRADKSEKTKIVVIEEKDMYLYDSLNKVNKAVEENWPPYNKGLYILAVNSRYKYIQDAIDNKYFDTSYFGWIDFSASHIVKIPKDYKFIKNITHNDKIRLAWISRYNRTARTFAYNHQVLGGGVFVGHKDIMKEFIKQHDKEFRSMLDIQYCLNDDRLLFYMYMSKPTMFDVYHSTYSDLLIKL